MDKFTALIDNHYEWVKRTKFLLAVMYGSPRRHSNSSKIFLRKKKNEKHLLTILGLAGSFKFQSDEQARPDLTVPQFDELFLKNFDATFIQVFSPVPSKDMQTPPPFRIAQIFMKDAHSVEPNEKSYIMFFWFSFFELWLIVFIIYVDTPSVSPTKK